MSWHFDTEQNGGDVDKLNWTAQIGDGAAYSTDDTGRLYAYVMGVLAGCGADPARAVMDANSGVSAAVTSGDAHVVHLPDGRALTIRTYGRIPEWGILPSGDSIRKGDTR